MRADSLIFMEATEHLEPQTPFQIFGNQVMVLTWANMKSRYRKTVAGFLWVILNPLIIYGVQSEVFSRVLKINVPNYYLFLLTGLLPWIFMVQTLEMCTSVFLSYSSVLKAFPTNPLVYLAAQVLDNLVNFLAAFLILLVTLSLAHPPSIQGLVLLPIPILFMVFGTLGMAWLLATLQVFFRDTRFLVAFVLNVAFFLTPVFYPPEFLPDYLRWMTYVNPFYIFIAPFRACLYDFHFTTFVAASGVSALGAMILVGLAWYVWRRRKSELYLYL